MMTKGIIPLVAIAWLIASCSNDQISPNANAAVQPQEFFGIGPDIPAQICGVSAVYSLQNNTQDILGEIEIQHTATDLYISLQIKKGWILNKIDIFNGVVNSFPRLRDQTPDPAKFKFQYSLKKPVNRRNIKIPLSEIVQNNHCIDFAIHAEIGQDDHFGGIYNLTDVWMRGESNENEFINHHCLRECTSVSQ